MIAVYAEVPRFHDFAPDFETPEWDALVEKLPSVIQGQPSSSRLLGGRNELYRLEWAGRNLVVKRFVNKGLWKKLSYRMVSSKAKRSYLHSVALLRAGIRSPEPIAWSEEWAGGWLKESYYVCAYLDFEHDASALLEPSCEDRAAKLSLLGETIARMHEAELMHLDVNQGNWLFRRAIGGGWELSLIDNNRMKQGPVSAARGVRCLLQLDFPEVFRDGVLASYASGRTLNFETCKSTLDKSCRRFELKWKVKNATRPWRRKLGL